MIVYRISRHAALDGAGGLMASGRWHTKGSPIIYCADSAAACLLEVLVHLEVDLEDLPRQYELTRIETSDEVPFETIGPAELPADWLSDVEATRRLGDSWLDRRSSAALVVPSAIVPYTSNILLNPGHPGMAGARTLSVEEHPWDQRLLAQGLTR